MKFDYFCLKFDWFCMKFDCFCLKFGCFCLKFVCFCLKFDFFCLKCNWFCLKFDCFSLNFGCFYLKIELATQVTFEVMPRICISGLRSAIQIEEENVRQRRSRDKLANLPGNSGWIDLRIDRFQGKIPRNRGIVAWYETWAQKCEKEVVSGAGRAQSRWHVQRFQQFRLGGE